jgi:hypothetical protein
METMPMPAVHEGCRRFFDASVRGEECHHPEHTLHPKRNIEYALVRTLIDGVFHVLPIDENDATEAVCATNCRKTKDSSCSIKTRAHLFAQARATATARRTDRGGLAIHLPDGAEQRPAGAPRERGRCAGPRPRGAFGVNGRNGCLRP